MDNFELPERYDRLSDETKEILAELCKRLQFYAEHVVDAATQALNALSDCFSSLSDMVEEIGEYIPRKKPIRPPKRIKHQSNNLFDKRARIHRCRNNC